MNRWPMWERVLFGAFLFWSAAGLIFTLGHLTPAVVSGWPVGKALRAFINGCVRTGDPILILLAFANTHVHASRQWTPTLARRWALIVLVCSLGIETIGAQTGFPFGIYHYTHRFGPLIGIVPLTIPLAWHVVVTNALFIVRRFLPHPSRFLQTATTALLCTLYDFILEPFATGAKSYWIWQGGTIPPQNYAAWLVLSFLLALIFSPKVATRYPRDPRPLVLLGATLLIFIAGGWL